MAPATTGRLAVVSAVLMLGAYLIMFGTAGGSGKEEFRHQRFMETATRAPVIASDDTTAGGAEGKKPAGDVGGASEVQKAEEGYAPDTIAITLDWDGAERRVVIALDRATAPITVDNFMKLVERGFFNGCTFYRAEKDFVLQGGGGGSARRGSPFSAIKLEANARNTRGTIAMARANDPDSASTEFFINLINNPHLDATGPGTGYAQFGRVIEGMDLVDAMSLVPVTLRSGLKFIDNEITFNMKVLSE